MANPSLKSIIARFEERLSSSGELFNSVYAVASGDEPAKEDCLSRSQSSRVVSLAFLQMVTAWEDFVECIFLRYMIGAESPSGYKPRLLQAKPKNLDAFELKEDKTGTNDANNHLLYKYMLPKFLLFLLFIFPLLALIAEGSSLQVTPPVITSALNSNGTAGVVFNYQITATNSPSNFFAIGLPYGLTINSNTGLISGTPTNSGNFSVNLIASNLGGNGSATLLVRISAPGPPVIISSLNVNGTVGQSMNYLVSATQNPANFLASSLPLGLSINNTTGLVSGTPTLAGNYSSIISATNSWGTGNATLLIRILPQAPVIESSLNAQGMVGIQQTGVIDAFEYIIKASNSPVSFGATGLPPGLSLNATTGRIYGIPTTGGIFTSNISATNAGGTGMASLVITLSLRPPYILLNSATSNVTVGTPFTLQISARNGPTSFSVTGLPLGMSVNSTTGIISGTPTTIGNFNLTLSATNGGGSHQAAHTLRVLPPLPVVSSTLAANAFPGVDFSFQVTATNNPTSFSASGLPPGLMINSTTGVVSGFPQAGNSAIYNATISASNAGGTGLGVLSIRVPPIFTSSMNASAELGGNFTYQISAGNAPSYFLISGLPPGLTFNGSTGVIYGKVFSATSQNYTVRVTATNLSGTTFSNFNLQVFLRSLSKDMVFINGGFLPSNSPLSGTKVEAFQMSKYETTWREWQVVRDWAVANGYSDLSNSLAGKLEGPLGVYDNNWPVNGVNFYDAIKWCNAKSEMEGLKPVYQIGGSTYKTGNQPPVINSSADGYRLPSTAEWEWAARGGVASLGFIYSGSNTPGEVVSTRRNWVGSKTPNELGLYDMSGNFWEWCWTSPLTNQRNIRGGGWRSIFMGAQPDYTQARIIDPGNIQPLDSPLSDLGFRVARNPGQRGEQTISSFTTIQPQLFGAAPFSVNMPSATSGLPVVLTIKSGPASITGNIITLKGAGAVVLSANQAGDANYKVASEVTTSFMVGRATPIISFVPSVGALSYGQALSNASLSGGNASVAGTFAFETPSTIPNAGTASQVVTFTPTDSGNYTTASANVSVAVGKATPVVAWSNPASIIYGTALGGAQLNASASVNGTFNYTSASGTVLGVGNQTLSVVFTPADTANYNTVNRSVTLAVGKGTPTINTLPSATALTYGQALSNASLSGGSASVSGTFAFASPSTIPNAGTTSQTVTFTPTDSINYNAVSANVSVTVGKATPVVTWNNPGAITYGTVLGGAHLNASASVNGTFNYTPASGTVLGAGNQTLSVVFTPTDTANYNTVSRSATIAVGKGIQSIGVFANIDNKVYGNAPFVVAAPTTSSGLPVALSVKSGPASISGNTITLTGTGTVVLAANQSGNADFDAAPEIITSFTVAGASQTISAFTTIPAKSFGTSPFNLSAPSSNSNLPVELSVKSGPATITGNTVTLTGVGTVVLAANQAGNANFGPAAEVTTSFVVNKGSQTIGTFTPVGGKAFGSAFSVIPPIASSGLPVVLSVKSGPATITANNTVTPTGLGTVVLAANQAGNANYNAAPEVTTSFVVGKGNQTISAFSAIGPKLVGAVPFVISAPSASSALPVVLTIKSGPAIISTNRTVTITGPGNVTIAANQAGNANFNSAPEVTTAFLVTRPLSTLTVTVPAANEGTVTLGFAGATTREIGANYTVTAIPASGMMSKGWRKGNATLSANARLNFVMESNMQLIPLFAPDFSKLAGTYNGLVGNGDIGTGAAKDMQAFPLKNGFVTFSLGSTGALSGNLNIDGQTSRFTGNFTTNRTAAITISRANKTPAQASLQLTPALPGEISGNITVSGEALSFRALRAAYTIGTASHALGSRTYTIGTASHALGSRTYTLAIPAPSGLALGHGFARVAIQKNGFATATGRLATGDVISASAGFVDSGDGNWVMPVYSTGNGIFTGEIVIPKTPSINSAELLGSFEWLRTANAASSLFPAGFLGGTNVAGTRYSMSAGNSFLSGNRTAAGFTLNIDPQRTLLPTAIAQKGTWPAKNTPALVQPISSGLKMTFSSANGSVQGVFNRTINGAQVPTQFQGAMFGKPVSTGNGQPLLRGAGYFISGNQSVPVEITLP